jgi:TPP-dependent pyruvate/acetoin dehydrogenase alpha subunit
MTAESYAAMDAEVVAEVQDAYDFADQAPDPEPSELYSDVYAPTGNGER